MEYWKRLVGVIPSVRVAKSNFVEVAAANESTRTSPSVLNISTFPVPREMSEENVKKMTLLIGTFTAFRFGSFEAKVRGSALALDKPTTLIDAARTPISIARVSLAKPEGVEVVFN